MTLKIQVLIFVVALIPNVFGNSCIQGVGKEYDWDSWNDDLETYENPPIETTYRYCEPPVEDRGRCKCHNIHINGTGDGDCGSGWCYVIGEDSGCKDKQISSRNEDFRKAVYLNGKPKTIYWTKEACTGNHLLPWKVGLEEFLPGYEILGSSPLYEFGGGGFYAPTPEACETECYTRKNNYCNAWTFIPGESESENKCYLKLDNVCENTLKARRANPIAISGFHCQVDVSISSCWSTTGNSVPDFCPYAQAGADGSETENMPGGTRIGSVINPRRYSRICYKFVRGRWRTTLRCNGNK